VLKNKLQFVILFCILVSGFFLFCFPAQAAVDSDADGLSDDIETKLGTDPNNSDTDGDTYLDSVEVKNGFSPFAGNRSRAIKRSVEIDLSKQKFYYLVNGVRIGTMLTSTGRPSAPSPVGTFKILRKVPVKTYYTITGGSYPNTKWNLEYKRGFYIHTAYWHNDFGIRPRSGGCINLTLADATKMYKFLDIGDSVKIYGKTPTGKLKLTSKID